MTLDLSSLKRGIASLERVLNYASVRADERERFEDENDIIKAAVAHNFEFTYELCWKRLSQGMIRLEDWELKCITAICSRILTHEEVIAFGSRVSGQTHDHSDLDIAIVGDGKLSLTVLVDLKEAFQDSDLSFRVDVVDYHRVSEGFQKVIMTTGERFIYR